MLCWNVDDADHLMVHSDRIDLDQSTSVGNGTEADETISKFTEVDSERGAKSGSAISFTDRCLYVVSTKKRQVKLASKGCI